MGFWNKAGRWLAWAIGLLFVIIGFNAFWHGLDIIQVERGWASVIAGTTAMCAGVLVILLAVLIDGVHALRLALLGQRPLQVAEVAPSPLAAAEEPLGEETEPPRPIEIPVEPPPIAPAESAPGAFSFRTFGKRPRDERPLAGLEPTLEIPEPPQASQEAPVEPPLPPEQIRRFAPPQFRRPSVVPPPPPEEPVALQSAPSPEPQPEPAAEPEEPTPVKEVEVEQVETAQVIVSVEASITEAIAEELRLPRASNLEQIPPVEISSASETPEAEPPHQAPEPPISEPALPHRGVAETHVWLEKALGGEEAEPALDWLRQRRGSEERPDRKVPSFMRRHVESEPEAPPSEPASDAPQEPTVAEDVLAAEEAPSVVGRYSANGSDYTLYANGSIDAQTPDGSRHFASMDELRAFLQRQNAPTEG